MTIGYKSPKVTKMLLTNTVFLVPVEFHAKRTQTLVAALCVYAAVLTAPIIDAALVNICHKAQRI